MLLQLQYYVLDWLQNFQMGIQVPTMYLYYRRNVCDGDADRPILAMTGWGGIEEKEKRERGLRK